MFPDAEASGCRAIRAPPVPRPSPPGGAPKDRCPTRNQSQDQGSGGLDMDRHLVLNLDPSMPLHTRPRSPKMPSYASLISLHHPSTSRLRAPICPSPPLQSPARATPHPPRPSWSAAAATQPGPPHHACPIRQDGSRSRIPAASLGCHSGGAQQCNETTRWSDLCRDRDTACTRVSIIARSVCYVCTSVRRYLCTY